MSLQPYWKGNDFPKDKEGEIAKPWAYGEKPCVNHPLNASTVSWGKLFLGRGGWKFFPHVHSTSRLHHFMWEGILGIDHSLHHFGPSSHKGTVLSSFFTHKILPGFSSRSKLEGKPQDTISVCIYFSLPIGWMVLGVCFPYRFQTMYFSRHFIVEIGAVVFPTLFICCGCNYLLWLLLSCFGHARAKNNSDSPYLT